MAKLFFNTAQSALLNDPSLDVRSLAPIEPSYSTALENEFRVNSIKFGNGYEQSVPDGLNGNKLIISVVFMNMSMVAIKAVESFLRGGSNIYDRTPADYFYWLPPAPFDTLGVRKFKCNRWKVVPRSKLVATLEAQFEETFEL
jgi:phage-related protein